jgi:hypothetical protein
MNIKITGKIEKPVEINPLDVIRELKLQLLGRNDYFIGDDGQVYYQKQCSLYGDYENTLAPQYIQEDVEVVKALNVLTNKLS